MGMNKTSRGFTLIELMIVVAIIGILVAVAYPSYQEHLGKGRRADAQGALMGLANAMERYFTENGRYVDAGGAAPALGAAGIYPNEAPIDGNTKYYDLSITAATQTTYALSAAPKGAQAADRCGTLTLTSTGVRGGAAADCWTR